VLGSVFVGALVVVTVLASAVGGVVADQRRVESAVDLGALAGASALQQGRDGCAAARSMVRRNGSRTASCAVSGPVVVVHASRHAQRLLGRRFDVSSSARAGPEGLVPGG
jgi:secretion/DNA translocation related TadE-like protein